MTEKKKIIGLTVIFLAVTYIISGAGYFLWFGRTKAEAAAFIPVLAPSIAGFCIYKLTNNKIRSDMFTVNIKGIGIGAGLVALCYLLAVILFFISGRAVTEPEIKTADVLKLFIQWIFAGFCEEFGWRCVLLPLLKKIFTLEKACFINGIVWALWHLPLILTCNMAKGHSYTGGFVLFMITTICLSYIFGVFSEFGIGKSVWTYVTVHALYNIVGVILMSMITIKEYRFLDEAGYFIVAALVLITAGVYAGTLKYRRDSKNVTV